LFAQIDPVLTALAHQNFAISEGQEAKEAMSYES